MTTNTQQSDIDIVVELVIPKMFDMNGIKQEIEAKFQRKVDIVGYREDMNPALKMRIDEESIYA